MRGGKRAGCGRKAVAPEHKRVHLAATISPKTMELLDTLVSQGRRSRGDALDYIANLYIARNEEERDF